MAIAFTSYTGLSADKKIYDIIENEILQVNDKLPENTKISKFLLLFIPNIILDYSLERKKFCKNGLISFSIRNYGEVCRFRSSTFAIKEPDTLKWIESFDKNSTFIDIGANVGIYSIYASHFTSQVFSFEPDALNYSLLNLYIL